jgi:hypothetical protein
MWDGWACGVGVLQNKSRKIAKCKDVSFMYLFFFAKRIFGIFMTNVFMKNKLLLQKTEIISCAVLKILFPLPPAH